LSQSFQAWPDDCLAASASTGSDSFTNDKVAGFRLAQAPSTATIVAWFSFWVPLHVDAEPSKPQLASRSSAAASLTALTAVDITIGRQAVTEVVELLKQAPNLWA
jgi:hypothetical protein